MIEKLKSHKKETIIGVIVGLVLIIILALVLAPDTQITNIFNTGNNTTTITESDVPAIQSIVEKENTSQIEIISNKNNDQADIILESLNIDIKDLYAYAGSIDSRMESAHVIAILRPKEDKVNTVKNNIRQYLYEKQTYFTENGLEASELYPLVAGGILYETDGYIVLVIEEDANAIMLDISEELKALKAEKEAASEISEQTDGTVEQAETK